MESRKLKCSLCESTLMPLPKQHLLPTSMSPAGTTVLPALVDRNLRVFDLSLSFILHHIRLFAKLYKFQLYNVFSVLSLKFFAWRFLDHTDNVIQTTNLYKNCIIVQFFREDFFSFLDLCQAFDSCLFFHSVFPHHTLFSFYYSFCFC